MIELQKRGIIVLSLTLVDFPLNQGTVSDHNNKQCELCGKQENRELAIAKPVIIVCL